MVYEKIISLCKEKGISIARLESECGIGNGTIARWDKSTPNLRSLQKVAAYFEKPISYFVE